MDATAKIRAAVREASAGLVDREALIELIVLAAVAGEHVLIVGPPGTAKSEVARRAARAVSGAYFEYLLGRFTEPSEIFGPVDLRKLREGTVETETRGMLPEAEVAFLDEVFLGSSAILNALLGILNERTFRRGHTTMRCPLRVCIAAANALPDDEHLAAFSDRFLVRAFVSPVADSKLEELLDIAGEATSAEHASMSDVDVLSRAAAQVDTSGVRDDIANGVRLLRKAGVALTDRRIVKLRKLVAAAAALDGRARATAADLWPIVAIVPTAEAQAIAREALRDLLAKTRNETLVAAAVDASNGPLARAAEIVETAKALLSARPPEGEAAWRLKVEGIARTIDASFTKDAMPADLADVRAKIVGALAEA
jgi:MoxR-like ATPase